MRIAIAKVTFQWDADKLRYKDSGSGLYRDIQAFWAAHGLTTEIVDVLGNSGERIIVLREALEDELDAKNQMVEPQVGIKQKLDEITANNTPKKKVLVLKKKKMIITNKKK